MSRDKKLGLALGVLLVGIVGAFFFRLDQKTKSNRDGVPQLNNEQSLNKQIAVKPVAPYTADTKPKDAAQPPNPAQNQANAQKPVDPPLWQMPDFLADGKSKMPEDWLAKSPAAPNPIAAPPSVNGQPKANPGPPNPGSTTVQNVSQSQTKPAQQIANSYIIHRVRPGDTLSGISAQYLGSSARFNEIYEINRDVLGNPNDLTVGTELKIPRRSPAGADSNGNDRPMLHSADADRRINSQNVSRSKSLPPGSRPPASELKKRFVPASRSPFSPGRRDTQTSQQAGPARGSLTQVPPSDLPDID